MLLSPGMPFDANYLVLAAILMILGGIIVSTNHYGLASDGSNYFSYLRSAVFDRDLDFHNEFIRFNKAFWMTYKPKATVTGHLTNVFSVGPAILWFPFYLAAHLFVLAANLTGAQFIADGFSGPYILAINLGSLFYGFAGMCLVYRMCKKYYDRTVSLIATVTVWLATFMLYYTLYEPYMSHATSFFAATLFIYYWDATRCPRVKHISQPSSRRQTRQWIWLGLAAGLMMLVRWQNALLMILPAIESIVWYVRLARSRSWPEAALLFIGNLLFLLFALAAFFPQMAAWKIIYGSFLIIPQGTSFLRWDSPFITELLFSSRHGLYAWSPVVYISTIGWLAFFKREKFLAWTGLLAFLLMTYVNSVVSDWWAGWGFGMRRYDGLIVLFALGLAAFLHIIKKRWLKSSVIATLCIFVFFTGYNLFLMNRYLEQKLHPGAPVAFGQLLGLSNTGIYRYTGYPFSFPANVIFSLKYGISPARYDTLAGGYIDDPYFYGDTILLGQGEIAPQPRPNQAVPGPADVLLGMGWLKPSSSLGKQYRAFSGHAVVYAPVRTVTDFSLEFSCANPQALPVDLTVEVNGHQLASFQPTRRWQVFKVKLSKDDLKLGINVLYFRLSSSEARVNVEYLKFKRLEYVPDWK
jgi:hypothetical protein